MASTREKSTIRRQIDENLQRVYEDTLNEQVPERFLDLIAKLRASEEQRDGK